MRAKRKMLFATAFAALLGVGAFAGANHANDVKAVNAEGDYYLYYAVQASTLQGYTVKLNLNIGDNGTWWTYEFTPERYTYTRGSTEYYILRADYNVKYGGVDTMQIQLYNGSAWVSQQQPFSSWTTTDSFNHKMYVHDVGWVAYTHNDVKTATVYVDAFDWGALNVYTFEKIGSKEIYLNGSWPGTSVSISDSNLKFNGGMLQKVTFEYVNSSKSNFIFNDGGSNQSGDMSYVEGNYYWHDGSSWRSDSTYGAAAAFVYDLNTARLAVPSSGSVKQYSICGLDAKTWVDRYDGLTASAKTYVDSATIYTYKDTSSSGADTTVTFAEVINELRSVNSASANSRILSSIIGENGGTAIIIIVISSIALAAIGGYFLFRKKKEN